MRRVHELRLYVERVWFAIRDYAEIGRSYGSYVMTFTRDKARAISLATAFIQDGIPFQFAFLGGRYAFEDLSAVPTKFRSMSLAKILEEAKDEQVKETAQEAE